MRKNTTRKIVVFLMITAMITVQGTAFAKSAVPKEKTVMAVQQETGNQEVKESQETENTETIEKLQVQENSEKENTEVENTEKKEENTENGSTEEIIKVTELDLGEYQIRMAVGDRQLLTVTVLPLNATEQTITYDSDNKKVAEINGMGRITAKSAGTAKITAACGAVTASFELTVVETLEEETEIIEVTDVEISDYENELEVDKTMTLTATVVPATATENTVFYQSSDPQIATVNSFGEVKGIAAGDVIIYCSAGGITREAFLTVKVATTKLAVNEDYLVLKPGQTFTLKTEVMPIEAAQALNYQSCDDGIVSVSASGVVTAKKCGSTSIIVSNGDVSASVSVIVNESGKEKENADEVQKNKTGEEKTYPDKIDAAEVRVVNREMLKYYYQNRTLVSISGDGYTILLNGNKICNYENELKTRISFEEVPEGIVFELNNGNELCGEIELKLEQYDGNYLYLYNPSKEKYQLLELDDFSGLKLTQGGKYLLTKEKISSVKMKKAVVTGGAAALLGLLLVYICLKRKYWFW